MQFKTQPRKTYGKPIEVSGFEINATFYTLYKVKQKMQILALPNLASLTNISLHSHNVVLEPKSSPRAWQC